MSIIVHLTQIKTLIGMGVIPLEFLPGDTREKLGLGGEEIYAIEGIAGHMIHL